MIIFIIICLSSTDSQQPPRRFKRSQITFQDTNQQRRRAIMVFGEKARCVTGTVTWFRGARVIIQSCSSTDLCRIFCSRLSVSSRLRHSSSARPGSLWSSGRTSCRGGKEPLRKISAGFVKWAEELISASCYFRFKLFWSECLTDDTRSSLNMSQIIPKPKENGIYSLLKCRLNCFFVYVVMDVI